MKYIINSTSISRIILSENGKDISIDMTIFFGVKGMDKISPSSIGCTVSLSLEDGNRNTLVAELNEKTVNWFNENYNTTT